MSETGWPNRTGGAFRVELRAEAIGLAGRGWPVVPGACVTDERVGDGVGRELRPVPVDPDWCDRASANPEEVAAKWAEAPYGLLVSTGTVLDALEVDAEVGKRAAGLLRSIGRPAPILALPDGSWLFLTRAAGEMSAELGDRNEVRLHSVGSWIPLPPTPFASGTVHWRVKPTAWGWRLPDSGLIHEVLSSAVYNTDTATNAAVGHPLGVAGSSAV